MKDISSHFTIDQSCVLLEVNFVGYMMTANDVWEFFKQDKIVAPWKFEKIKLGIVWRIYMGMPYEACWGGFEKKNLFWFDLWLRKQKNIDQMSFIRGMGGLLILWRSVQQLVRRQDLQRRLFIPHVDIYSIAWLFHLTDRQIDLGKIWKNQKVGDSILDILNPMSRIVHNHIRENTRYVLATQYCKRQECWDGLKTRELILPPNIRAEYIADPRYIVRGDISFSIN